MQLKTLDIGNWTLGVGHSSTKERRPSKTPKSSEGDLLHLLEVDVDETPNVPACVGQAMSNFECRVIGRS
jgi:hypothetical protein